MSISNTQIEGISRIIKEASGSPLGIVALLTLLIWALAYVYFGRERLQKDSRLLIFRLAVFVLVFLGAIGVTLLVRPLANAVPHTEIVRAAKQIIHQPAPQVS